MKLRRLIKSPKFQPVCLHLGSGGDPLNNWINIDINVSHKSDVLLDLTKRIPLPDGLADFINTEDFIEHIDLREGTFLISECYRVLKTGGVLRISTPDLEKFISHYIKRDQATLEWYRLHCGCTTFCEMLNSGMKGSWGHVFVYDREALVKILKNAGFSVEEVSYNISKISELRGIDKRNEISSDTMRFDCIKEGNINNG